MKAHRWAVIVFMAVSGLLVDSCWTAASSLASDTRTALDRGVAGK